MRIWRLLGAMLVVPVMLGGLLLVTAEPAAGCTCVQMTEAQHAASVKTVLSERWSTRGSTRRS